MPGIALALMIVGLVLSIIGFRARAATANSVLSFISGLLMTLIGVGWLAALLLGAT